MEIEPISNYSYLVFKLPKGYISKAKIYAEFVNIDDSNDLMEFFNEDNIEFYVNIPHKLYNNVS